MNAASNSGAIMGGSNNNNQSVQRCVIITRDETGYGLTVSGDNPVFVQSVKEGKAFQYYCIRRDVVIMMR